MLSLLSSVLKSSVVMLQLCKLERIITYFAAILETVDVGTVIIHPPTHTSTATVVAAWQQ
jgi:hypothetical protein